MDLRAELSGAFGPISRTKLAHLRTLFDETEPLVDHTEYDDSLNPRVLRVVLSDGFESAGRFDVRWSELDHYSFHYTEPGLDARFDRHPNPHSPEKHSHPTLDACASNENRLAPLDSSPPNASGRPLQSCIEVERVELVGLAVLERWRSALDRDDPGRLNEGENPP